jgi:hypothetical protein
MKHTLSAVCLLFLLFSCTTSKFDYQTAYKFSRIQHHPKVEPTVVNPVASLQPQLITVPHYPSDKMLREIDSPNDKAAAFIASYKNASKQEKKKIRRQIKEEYKSLRKQVKLAKKDAVAKDVVFNQKMYIGLVIFAAGILIAILASGAFGAVAIIVGIGLIAWGFIEQA